MKTKLEELSKRTMSLITEAAGRDDVEAIQHLSSTAKQIKHLQEQVSTIERDVTTIDGFLQGFSARPNSRPAPVASLLEQLETEPINGRKSRAKKLRIEVDWSRIGKPGNVEVISDHTSSSTMARFIQRLFTMRGHATLEKLSGFRISRGPMVSVNPHRDYRNNATGALYGHQEIPGTRYHVLTHSSNSQKVSDLREACKFVDLPFGMVRVSEVEK